MRDTVGAMDGVNGIADWTAEIAALEGKLALARARLISRLVHREIRGEDPSLVDQTLSKLGRNKHIAAVKRRMGADPPLPGATKQGRRYLLTQEAYAEELGLARRPPLAKTDAPPPPDDAATLLVAKLQRMRARR